MSDIPSVNEVTRKSAHRLFSITRVMAIAGNTFRDLVRQKVFYFMVVFGLILIGASIALTGLSFQGKLQTVMDVSFGAMSVFTMLLGVLATAMLLPKDIEDRTLYTILAKPVARFEYLCGKMLGVIGILLVATLLMTALFVVVLAYWKSREIEYFNQNSPPDLAALEIARVEANTFSAPVFCGIGVIFLRSVVCATLTLMISCFATSWLFTIIISLIMIIGGHLVPIARAVWQEPAASGIEPAWYLGVFLRFVTVFLPDMQLFNVVDDIAVGTAVPTDVFASIAGLGIGYVLVYLFVGYLFFMWREI